VLPEDTIKAFGILIQKPEKLRGDHEFVSERNMLQLPEIEASGK
jgi:hypothetical protein